MDVKRALAAYVSGRNGGWDSELKLRSNVVADAPGRSQATETSDSGPVSDSAGDGSDFGKLPAHEGVPVPRKLAFVRGPGTWRRRIEDVPRG